MGTAIKSKNSFTVIKEFLWNKYTEAEIQLPLKSFPDSSASSLIQAGWCEEGYPATKNLLQYLLQHSRG